MLVFIRWFEIFSANVAKDRALYWWRLKDTSEVFARLRGIQESLGGVGASIQCTVHAYHGDIFEGLWPQEAGAAGAAQPVLSAQVEVPAMRSKSFGAFVSKVVEERPIDA